MVSRFKTGIGKSSYRGLFMEWTCCGLIWQLQMWNGQPLRRDWYPVCPACFDRGVSFNEMAEMAISDIQEIFIHE